MAAYLLNSFNHYNIFGSHYR